MTGLHCLLQSNQKLLLFLMPLLHFIMLLFKYVSVMLKNVRESGRKHDVVEERVKTLFSIYVLLTQVPSWNSSNKLNRTSKAQS